MTTETPRAGDDAHIERLTRTKTMLAELRTFVSEQLEHADSALTKAQRDWRGQAAEAYRGHHNNWQAAAEELNRGLGRVYAAAVAELERYNTTDETSCE